MNTRPELRQLGLSTGKKALRVAAFLRPAQRDPRQAPIGL